MSSTAPDAGKYWPISSRKRWRSTRKRAQQYARTTGSSKARTTLRIVSFRIESVAGARDRRLVPRTQPLRESRKALDTLVAAGGPAALEQDDHARRMSVEISDEFVA